MRRRVVALALPFPRQSGTCFYHDLWLALVAEATGGIALIRRPLVDYRQHPGNAVGAVTPGCTAAGPRRRRIDMAWLRREAAAYGLARYLAISLDHRVRQETGTERLASLRAYTGRLRGPGRHLLDMLRYGLTGNRGLARLAMGAAIISSGRIVWALRHALSEGLTTATRTFDDRLFTLSPGSATSSQPDGDTQPQPAAQLIDSRKTARWTPDFTAPQPSVTVLVPTLNPSEIFAGIATAVDLGLELAARGPSGPLHRHRPAAGRTLGLARVPDPPPDARATRRRRRRAAFAALRRDRATHSAHREDRFVATAWWTAILARKLIGGHGFLGTATSTLSRISSRASTPGAPSTPMPLPATMTTSSRSSTPPCCATISPRRASPSPGRAMAFRPAIDIARHAATPRPERRPGARAA